MQIRANVQMPLSIFDSYWMTSIRGSGFEYLLVWPWLLMRKWFSYIMIMMNPVLLSNCTIFSVEVCEVCNIINEPVALFIFRVACEKVSELTKQAYCNITQWGMSGNCRIPHGELCSYAVFPSLLFRSLPRHAMSVATTYRTYASEQDAETWWWEVLYSRDDKPRFC